MIDTVAVVENVSYCQLSHVNSMEHRTLLMPTQRTESSRVGAVNANNDLETLLADETLLSLPEVSENLGVVITRVHDLLNDNKLIAYVQDGKRVIPAALFGPDGTTGKFVPGVITLLTDGGYSDVEILTYLFTPDETLPGRPVEALHGHLAREVLRRAQAMAL